MNQETLRFWKAILGQDLEVAALLRNDININFQLNESLSSDLKQGAFTLLRLFGTKKRWWGDSALHVAARNNLMKSAQFLLDCGIDVSMVSKDGNLAVDVAASQEMKDLIQKYMKKSSFIRAQVSTDSMNQAQSSINLRFNQLKLKKTQWSVKMRLIKASVIPEEYRNNTFVLIANVLNMKPTFSPTLPSSPQGEVAWYSTMMVDVGDLSNPQVNLELKAWIGGTNLKTSVIGKSYIILSDKHKSQSPSDEVVNMGEGISLHLQINLESSNGQHEDLENLHDSSDIISEKKKQAIVSYEGDRYKVEVPLTTIEDVISILIQELKIPDSALDNLKVDYFDPKFNCYVRLRNPFDLPDFPQIRITIKRLEFWEWLVDPSWLDRGREDKDLKGLKYILAKDGKNYQKPEVYDIIVLTSRILRFDPDNLSKVYLVSTHSLLNVFTNTIKEDVKNQIIHTNFIDKRDQYQDFIFHFPWNLEKETGLICLAYNCTEQEAWKISKEGFSPSQYSEGKFGPAVYLKWPHTFEPNQVSLLCMINPGDTIVDKTEAINGRKLTSFDIDETSGEFYLGITQTERIFPIMIIVPEKQD